MSFDFMEKFSRKSNLDHASPSPRNVWARLRQALDYLACGDFYEAKQTLDGLSYNDRVSPELLNFYREQVSVMQAESRGVDRINIPSDYLQNRSGLLRLPFRKLVDGVFVPKPYPWGMALPEFVGTANNSGFLYEAGAALSGKFAPAISNICVVINCLNTGFDSSEPILRALERQDFRGKINVHIFGQGSGAPSSKLPGNGSALYYPFGLLSAEGITRLDEIQTNSDVILFLSGNCTLDEQFLKRMLFIAEISDRAVFPIMASSNATEPSTVYSVKNGSSRFGGRYPFREISGLNLAVSTKLFRKCGGLSGRFNSTFMAARELSYRLFIRGAYFCPLIVNDLKDFNDHNRSSADSELYISLCPNHWDRKSDNRNEVSKVTIYIPAYNASKYIQRAVESVLSQDMEDLDVCIANDGSTDHTLEILHKAFGNEPRVRWIENRNGGIGFASNSAIRMSQSLYIGQLDSDDCLKPGAVKRLSEFLDENPKVVCAYGSCERIDKDGAFTQNEYSWPVFSREKMMITSIAHHFRMFRRQTWERSGYFREDIVNGIDYDIFLKMSELGEFHHIDEKLYQRRWHGENTSHVNEHHQTANTYRVQREALKRLGMDQHWDIFVQDPEKPRLVTYKLKEGTPVVVFWPDYSSSNPYQKLLYHDLRKKAEVVSGTIDAALKLVDSPETGGSRITFHLHWTNFLFQGLSDDTSARLKTQSFIDKIEKFVKLGGRFVWTIHNSLSHDGRFALVEAEMSKRLAELAHSLHFHSDHSIAEVDAYFPIPKQKVKVARHGNYLGVYPDYITREAARRTLNIKEDDDVILFLGQIRKYKGVENLINVFGKILEERPKALLILAGKPDSETMDLINSMLSSNQSQRILVTGRFIEDSELQVFFRAADVAAFPYNKILTSGSMLLALSYGVPVVAPKVGMTEEVFSGSGAGILFDGDNLNIALEKALRQIFLAKEDNRLELMARSARMVAEKLSWEDFGSIMEI